MTFPSDRSPVKPSIVTDVRFYSAGATVHLLWWTEEGYERRTIQVSRARGIQFAREHQFEYPTD